MTRVANAAANSKSRDLLVSLFADTVELRHVPPSPSDGPILGRVLSDVSGREAFSVQIGRLGAVEYLVGMEQARQ